MDAMIFAAGLGTRLRPLTDTVPKSLVDVGGVPMLEQVAGRLIDAGATRLVVNVHYHAPKVIDFIARRNGFGVETLVSDESDLLLDTGGGLKKAAPLLRRDAPFLIHNADVLSDIDLRGLYRAHLASDAIATLAVMQRDTRRYLIFDQKGLCGYGRGEPDGERMSREPVGRVERLGFCGVHAASPQLLDLIEEEGAFSIIFLYLRLSQSGYRIAPYRVDGSLWIDIGKPDQLALARSANRHES